MASALEQLRTHTLSSPSPSALKSSTSLSGDAKVLTFLATNQTVDASSKQSIESVATPYSLASLYLACLHSKSFVEYRKACREANIEDVLKATERLEVLKFFGCGSSGGSEEASQTKDGDNVEEGSKREVRSGDGDRDHDRSERDKRRKHHHHSSRDKDRHHGRDREKDRHHSRDSSRKHHKDKHHRDRHHDRSSRDRDRDRDREDGSKKEKKSSTPMTNEQILDNLTMVAGKRGENRRVNQDDVVMMEEMANVVVKDDSGSSHGGSRGVGAGLSSGDDRDRRSMSKKGEEGDELWEKELVLAVLSAEGYTLEGRDISVEERDRIDKISFMEHPVGNSASILRFSGRDFSKVLELYVSAKEQDEKIKLSSSATKRDYPSQQQKSSQKKKPLGLPVIIVPNAMTSPIAMINAKEFFSQAKFIPRDIQMKKGVRKMTSLTIKRRTASHYGGTEVEYEIIDNPLTKIHRKHWDRVVAVVAQGAEWQFKGWPISKPVDIFTKTYGFYVGMEGAPIPRDVQTWSVKRCVVSRDRRGLDSITYASFWNGLDQFMAVHKPEYMNLT